MPVIRVERNQNYTSMANYHFKDRRLSLKAKGLMSLMLSLPEDWDYTVAGLVTLSKDGRDSVQSALQELEAAGYLRREQTHDKKGNFSKTNYVLSEKPSSETPLTEKPSTVKPSTGKPLAGKRQQLNNLKNKRLNNKRLNNKVDVDYEEAPEKSQDRQEASETSETDDLMESLKKVLQSYQANISHRPVCSPIEIEHLQNMVREYGAEGKTGVLNAIARTVIRTARPNLGYMEAILKGWKANGYDEETEGRGSNGRGIKRNQRISAAVAGQCAEEEWTPERNGWQ